MMPSRLSRFGALVIVGLITTSTANAIFQPKSTQPTTCKAQGFLSSATPRSGYPPIATDLAFLPGNLVTREISGIRPADFYNGRGGKLIPLFDSNDEASGDFTGDSEETINADSTTATIATGGMEGEQVHERYEELDPFVRARGRVRRIYPHPITFDDIVKHRMIPQPPSRKHEQQVIARKPFKRLGIPERIKLEKRNIEANTKFLDNYFANLIRQHGFTKHMDKFPEPTMAMNDCMFDFEEMIRVCDTHGFYFYISLPKAVALADIITSLAYRYSHARPDYFKQNKYGHNRSIRHLLSSIHRHVSIVNRVHIPKHLIDQEEMLPHIPKLTAEDVLAVAGFQRFFQLPDPTIKEWLLDMFQQCIKKLPPEQITLMIHRLYDVLTERKDILAQCAKRLKEDIEAFLSLDIKIVSKTIRRFRSSYYHDVELLDMCADYFLQGDKITIENVFHLFAIFARGDYLSEPLYKKMYAVLTANLKKLPWDANCIRWLMCDIDLCHVDPPRELLDELSRILLDKVFKLSMIDFTVVVRNFARLGHYNPELFQIFFNIPMIKDSPTLAQAEHFVLGLTSDRSYEVYKQLTRTEFISIISMAYETYLAYQLECESSPKFTLSNESLKNLLDCYIYYDRLLQDHSFSQLLEMKQLLYEEFKIVAEPIYHDPSGLRVDLAILPRGLSEIIENVDFIRDKKFGLLHRSPYQYIQSSLKEGTPPLKRRRLLYKRLLTKLGWQLADVPYWQYVSWMSQKAKAEFLYSLLPEWIQQIVKKPS